MIPIAHGIVTEGCFEETRLRHTWGRDKRVANEASLIAQPCGKIAMSKCESIINVYVAFREVESGTASSLE